MKKVSKVLSYIFIFIALYVFVIAGAFPKAAMGVPGPGYFPRILSVVVIILSIIELFQCRLTGGDGTCEGIKLFSMENLRVWVSLGFIIFYFAGLAFAGFAISTAIYLFVMLRYFKVKSIIVQVAVPLGLTSVLFFIFTVLLKVQLPVGILF
ncbi:MAG TPA: tripartite tricarboxylate transporter TctB family protein [Epulopiscium sp.]|nr:tripartite tricarboxylate transporter TctB family protein [Candidatus Epulonipiscium sp.]